MNPYKVIGITSVYLLAFLIVYFFVNGYIMPAIDRSLIPDTPESQAFMMQLFPAAFQVAITPGTYFARPMWEMLLLAGIMLLGPVPLTICGLRLMEMLQDER